jgi:hypothetical protein
VAREGLTWDDPKWAEKGDSPWMAGCRWLQAWWRDKNGWPTGPRTAGDEKQAAAMLHEGVDDNASYFDLATYEQVEEFFISIGYGSVATRDRYLRNLMSSEPIAFNIFGPFTGAADGLLPWVKKFDTKATAVDEVRFQWAPKKSVAFPGGSLFDACVVYRAGDSRRFIGVETKYADDPNVTSLKVRQPNVDATVGSKHWREGADRRLEAAALRQTWLNTLMAQALVDNESEFDRGQVVVLSCEADVATSTATGVVRAELAKPDTWLTWRSYESVVDALAKSAPAGWAAWFRERYLDFKPVAHKLEPDDPRVARGDGAGGGLDALAELVKVGQEVLAKNDVIAQLARGERKLKKALDAAGLSKRAAALAVDLQQLRQAINDASK